MAYPQQTFADFAELLAYINTEWINNGNGDITGIIGNNVVNGLLTFIEQSPLNWQKAQLVNSAAAQIVTGPVVVFMVNAPAQISFLDNIYNEFCFINTTSSAIPLLSPAQYYNINLVAVTSIPAKSIVRICKATNNSWIISSVPNNGSQSSLPPLIGVVDGGGANDPVSGISTFQHNSLKGLGGSNGGKIQIQLDGANLTNFGVNQSIIFDAATGTIDINYNSSGNTWQTGSGLYVDLNQ